MNRSRGPSGDDPARLVSETVERNIVARSHLDFIGAVLGEFPELREQLEESAGLPHAQAGEFATFTQAAKDRGDPATYERCMKLVDRVFAEADADLAGILRGSYIEHLEFEGSRGPAFWRLVPPRLQNVWNQIAAENRRLMALPQKHAQPNQPRPSGGLAGGPRRRKRDDRRRPRRRR